MIAQKETVVYRSKPHWIYLARPASVALVGLMCACCSIFGSTVEPPPGQEPPPQNLMMTLAICSSCILMLAFVAGFVSLLKHINSDFTITNRRVILEVRGGRSRSLEIPLAKIDSVYVETSTLGRLFGYGLVVVNSHASRQPLVYFANPQAIRQKINEQIARVN